MSNVLRFTIKAELTKLELDALINKDRQVFRIPDSRGSREDFFSIELGKDTIPDLWVLPDDLTITVGKHSESAKGAHLDKYHVIYKYTFWKEITNVDVFEYLKDYSSKIVKYVVDLDSDIQGTHFLDFPRAPHYAFAVVYIDGKEIEYTSNEEVVKNLMFYDSVEKLSALTST